MPKFSKGLPPFLRPDYSPALKPSTYQGPTVPVAYDPDWQHFNNLTPNQIAWFQAQPEWANFLAYVALSPATATPGVPVSVVNATLQAAGKPVSVTPLPSPLQPIVVPK